MTAALEVPTALLTDDALASLENMDAESLVRFAFDRFGDRAAVGTSFQQSGLVLIDLAMTVTERPRVFTIDTLRLHSETYGHIDAVERHFGIQVERFRPNPTAVEQMVRRHGEFLFFDSVPKRQLCCRIRKDVPNDEALATLDCWITGVRRDQSDERAALPKATLITRGGRSILKLAPLADWTTEGVEQRIAERGLPTNPLMTQGYPSIGCFICTTPVRAWEEQRAGRWRWESAGTTKECGIHFEAGSGI